MEVPSKEVPAENIQDMGSSQASGKKKEEPVEDDDLYCLQSSFVFFQVERRLFHVPNYRFINESQFFSGMFRLPSNSFHSTEGSNRDNPIILPNNIRKEDFRNFLKALYPLTVSVHLSLSKEEWISVLRLSTFWYFLKYREMAIAELELGKELTSTDKIRYGREFRLHSWVLEGLDEIVQRSNTIDKQEALVIDYETAFSLFRIREGRLQRTLDTRAATSAIKEEFKVELGDVLADEWGYKSVEEDIEFEDAALSTSSLRIGVPEYDALASPPDEFGDVAYSTCIAGPPAEDYPTAAPEPSVTGSMRDFWGFTGHGIAEAAEPVTDISKKKKKKKGQE